ncbi:AraC family transcriptional regulator [Konateibacter massiliensis]|uniref:AraC family transcriptional regulator n=1 Tax=Konateibacter massiliensis TaxID=2002841 RepID=UPI001F211106|nr:AraC family transcriptional regulator [Konateibacter massiliensis]
MEALNESIEFMESHLLENITSLEVADSVHMSHFYYQHGFKILTGYTVGEYIRSRRLTLAGMELVQSKDKVIDIAYKYGYETPESFAKAFSRFHGFSPSQIRQNSYRLQTFNRLFVKISVEGGTNMDYRIEKKEAFQVLGLGKEFSMEKAYAELPQYWTDYYKKYGSPKEAPVAGMYGICDDMQGNGKFRYIIADTYEGGEVPDGFEVVEIPAYSWAIFTCLGPMPGALQTVNTRIFSEWLPNNREYEIAADISIEMYTDGDNSAADYLSEIWVPVKAKTK